jgi:hypothetical protein
MWSTSPGLIVGPGTQRADYSATATTDAPLQLQDAEYIALGRQLVSSVVSYYPIKLASVLYYTPNVSDLNFTSRDQATAIQVTYLPTLKDIPLIAGDPKSSEAIVRYSADKTILYFSGYIYPQFVQTGASSPIISLSEAETRLLAGKGTILSAGSTADINAADTKWYQFNVSGISKVDLAYYYDFTNKHLSPVFLFYGTATDKTTQNKVDTVSVVSAVP